jgi:alpha-1,2-mannosyltransferase
LVSFVPVDSIEYRLKHFHLELDNHFLKYHADKKKRLEERGEKCYGTAPEAMDGAIELLEEL